MSRYISNYLNSKRARLWATLWTLLIFVLCLLPGNELPAVNVPFIDKWTHVVLFAIFSFLWLRSIATRNALALVAILIITLYTGSLVEYIQGHYIPGRSQDIMDVVADVAGGVAGMLIFLIYPKAYSPVF